MMIMESLNEESVKGKAFVFDKDDIDTDMIIPAKYLNVDEPKELAKHAMEFIDPGFPEKVGSMGVGVVVGGRNFGCGSSREQPTVGLRHVGVSAIVARSFARIFYRSAINQGLLLVQCPEAVDAYVEEGGEVAVDARAGLVRVGEREFRFPALPDEMMRIIEAGGLLSYISSATDAGGRA